MPRQKTKNTLNEFEDTIEKQKHTKRHFVFRLYVTGATGRSTRAIESIKALCEKYLKDRYKLEVIDIYQNPETIESEDIVAAPTLIKELPLPLRRFIGDLTDTEKILIGLELKKQDETGQDRGKDGQKKKDKKSAHR